uniref:JNK1/MAPK8 associated membrane protein n=1 Tax=Oryctolagus cuniculus TaxID=9986 RepID=A0A5F9DJP0_RABIT
MAVDIQPACLGLYCGKTLLFKNGSTEIYGECGVCPRGQRTDAQKLCQPCTESPELYDWLYLGFMAMLPLVLHWFFIEWYSGKKRYTIVFIYYAFCLVFMMLLRPLLVKKIACGLGKSDRCKSIYASCTTSRFSQCCRRSAEACYVSGCVKPMKYIVRMCSSTAAQLDLGRFICLFVYFKVRIKERKQEKKLTSTGSLPKWLQWPGLCQAKARSQELLSGLPCFGYRGPSSWAIFTAFPGHYRKLDQKCSSHMECGAAGSGLTRPVPQHQPGFYFILFKIYLFLFERQNDKRER